jgi:MutS-like protein
MSARDYERRSAEYAAAGDAERRRSVLISRLRLSFFLPGIALLIWSSVRQPTPLTFAAAAALLLVFGALVVWHARVEERIAWLDALRTVNDRAIARIDRRWDALPPADAPPAIDITHHPYAIDLDLFGRASLFQWLGPAASAGGRDVMARWLLEGAERADILARQQAVQELAEHPDWRETFAAHGVLATDARQPEIDRLLAWAEDRNTLVRRPALLRAAAIAIVISQWTLFVLWIRDVTEGAFWMLPLVTGIVISFAYAYRIEKEFNRAGSGQRALARYAHLLEQATAIAFTSPGLAALQHRLGVGGVPAAGCMRRLNRILGFAEMRRGAAIFHFLIQAVTLWDFFVHWALERWRDRAGRHVRDWLNALAELDALSLLAGARSDNPDWAMPAIQDAARVAAEGLGHPLIHAAKRVANDVAIGPPGTLLLITGSNMSGKSTLLRAIGLNAVLAQAGGAVCARALSMPAVRLETSVRVQDSLELGLSYFMAALARLKGIVDAACAERSRSAERRDSRVMLYLLDEILQGTNSVERAIAVRAVARHLLEAGAIGAMTTHDLALAAEEPLKSAAQLVHFSEVVDTNGSMSFDYQLRPGLATSRNALRLMQMIGIPVIE